MSYSCLEGVLRISGDSRVCAWEEELVESSAASASCSPAGVPLSCRYMDAGGVSRFGILRYGCPSGWVLSGSSCSRSTSVERTAPPAEAYSCERGVLVGSSCYEYAEAVRSCSPGWVLRVSGVCEREIREAARSAQSTSSSLVAATSAPGRPQNVSVLVWVESATLIWAPPSDDGGSPVVGYVLRWREGTSGTWTEVQLEASARSYLFTNLVGGGYYQVKLSAKNTDPDGEPREGRPAIKGLNPCSVGQQILGGLSYVYCADAPPPNPPRPGGKLSLTPGVESLTAVWGATVASEGDAAVAGFRVSWRRERGRLEPGSGWDWEDIENATLSSHLIDGLTGGVPYQVKVQSFSSEGRLSPALMRDGVPEVADACRTSAEPGFWDQVFDPVLGLCVEPPGSFRVEVEKGDGKLSVSVEWQMSFSYYHHGLGLWRNYARRDHVYRFFEPRLSEIPVSDYVVRWRKRGSSGDWSSSKPISHSDVRLNPDRIHIERSIDIIFDPRARYHFVVDVHVIEGLVNGERYEVEVDARNPAGHSTSTNTAYGDPCEPQEVHDPSQRGCVARPPAAEGVVLTSGDRSLTLRWRLPADAVANGHSVQLLHGSLDRVRFHSVWVRGSDGVEKTVGGKQVREWSHTFSYETPPGGSQIAPAGVLLRNGQSYKVRVTPWSLAGFGEAVVIEGSPCEDCSTVVSNTLPPPTPPPPVACPTGEVLVSDRCLASCPPGQVRPPGGSNCVTPTSPTRVSSSFWAESGPRAGDLWLRWNSSSFDNGGLQLTGYKIRWRRLDGSFMEQEYPLIPLSAVEPSRSRRRPFLNYYPTYDRQYIISGLAVGARYTVSVAAVNERGESDRRIYAIATTACGRPTSPFSRYQRNHNNRVFIPGEGICIFQPRRPTALAAAPAAEGAVSVSWEQHDWDNYYPVTGYQLEWRPKGSSGAWTTVEPSVPWTDGTADTTPAGAPLRRFTHTITGLTGATAAAGSSIQIRVASLNQIPSDHIYKESFTHHSEWVTSTATTCPAGQVSLSAAAGCADIPSLPSSTTSKAPSLTLHPESGSVNAVWWQRTAELAPSEYKLEWKKTGSVTWTPAPPVVLQPADVNVPLPSGSTYSGWTLNAHLIEGLDMCTYDVRVTAIEGTEKPEATAAAAPQGTVVAPGKVQRTLEFYGKSGGKLSVFWERPACDGGAPLKHYAVRWGTMSGTTFTRVDSTTVADSGNRFYTHEITGLTDEEIYRVFVKAVNTSDKEGLEKRRTKFLQDETSPARCTGDYCWAPYTLPNFSGSYAQLNDRVRRGEAIRVCTSAPDFVKPVRDAVNAWNSRVPGLFTFGNVSTPAECGEKAETVVQSTGTFLGTVINNSAFDVAVMDYRPGAATSCRVVDASTPRGTHCHTANSWDGVCDVGRAAGCASTKVIYHKDFDLPMDFFHPYVINGSVTRINEVKSSTDRVFTHELGHFLGLADYRNGCGLIGFSLFSYGPSFDDWKAAVANPTSPDLDCRSTTITSQDIQDLHAIYHPAAFTGLSFMTKEVKGETEMYLKFGAPPQGTRGHEYLNAYRYVVLHRPPKASPGAAPNTFTQLMNGGNPVVITPEQVKKPGASIGELDSGRFMLSSVNLNDSAFAALRVTGHEFVVVGVTRGDHEGEPDKTKKPLNPASAAGLEHAVMSLNLGGSDGVGDWTLGTPVSTTYP